MTAHLDPTDDGLLFACILDGAGGARSVGWPEIEAWTSGDGPLWVHLDKAAPRAQTWLRDSSGLTAPTADALLANETRPRVFRGKRGVAAILRGVNLNLDASPQDMVALRMWSEGERVITLRTQRLQTPRDIFAQLTDMQTGPTTAPELFERLITKLSERMTSTVGSFEDRLDTLESDLDIAKAAEQRRILSTVRQDAVILRRYIAPQREALNDLVIEPPLWLDDTLRPRLRETADRLLRYVEELDATRERAMVIKDDIANQMAEATNTTLYVLAIISAIFLPLSFLTGLLGINVGGMPGVDNDAAFWIVCGLMAVCLVAELALFRKLKWL